MNIIERPRRLRQSAALRDLVRETSLHINDIVLPVFVTDGVNVDQEVPTFPLVRTVSIDNLARLLDHRVKRGLRAVLLFGKVHVANKTEAGDAALDPNGCVPRAVRQLREVYPDLTVLTDVALDPYTTHGHDGIVHNGDVDNDLSVDILSRMALVHAEAGAHMVAPSDMMDGRVGALRSTLDTAGFHNVGIMSYTAKYASALYGPFRDVLESTPSFGDKKTYQMDPANIREAERECRLDLDEGADIILVKPATWYLDVVARLSAVSDRPVAAYHVSGEAAMILSAAHAGHINRHRAVEEVTLAIKRAGASIIISYFVDDIFDILAT